VSARTVHHGRPLLTGPRGQQVITGPGMYEMDEATYHGDPAPGDGSLSCSGAKLLLPPSCPAVYEWRRKQPHKATRAMEFGTAAHKEVLGTGWPVAVYDGKDWTTKAAKEFAKEARGRGEIPILGREREQISAMAAAIAAKPATSLLLRAEEVWNEESWFWQDDETGIWLRARFDAVKLRSRVAIVDYKTAYSADSEEFAKAAGKLRYHMQDPWYREAVTHVLGDADPLFLFVVQEKEPPYVVAVYELDGDSLWAGAERNRRARRLYARCVEAGEWPGHQIDESLITKISVPRWAL
jgi:hypothetical protein